MARKDALTSMREILVKRRDALRKALAGDMSMLNELSQEATGDVVDFALDSAHDEISSQLAEVESRELVRIENALEKMEEGTYGRCEGCNCNIPLARLQALPYAILCIKCQRISEQHGIDPSSVADWSRIIDVSADDVRLNDLDFNVS